VSAAGVGVCGGGYPRVSRPRALRTTPSPPPIYGFPTTKHTRIYPLLLLLRSHAATGGVTVVRAQTHTEKRLLATPSPHMCVCGVYTYIERRRPNRINVSRSFSVCCPSARVQPCPRGGLLYRSAESD